MIIVNGFQPLNTFVIIVNGFQPLTTITKHSILDVAAALDPPLLTRLSFPTLHSLNLYDSLQHQLVYTYYTDETSTWHLYK